MVVVEWSEKGWGEGGPRKGDSRQCEAWQASGGRGGRRWQQWVDGWRGPERVPCHHRCCPYPSFSIT